MNTKPSVMFVMKDHKLRSILLARFERENWKVEGAEDVIEGERKAVRFRPKIFMFEWMEGDETMKKMLKHFRSLPTLHTAKIVILLKRATGEQVNEAHASGADGVMLWGSMPPRDMIKFFAKLLAI